MKDEGDNKDRADMPYAESGTLRLDAAGDGMTVGDAAAPAVQRGSDLHSLYSIQAKIGGGGMGVVYLAKDLRLGRFVAIKRLNAIGSGNAALRRRFLNEAHAVAALGHIYIVHIYSLGEDEEGPYIVMEYVEGPESASGGERLSADAPNPPLSLERQVAEKGQYTLDEALELVMKLAKAVAYAHACGVIHRDLKPSNVLIDSAGEPKIIDFGLARMTSGDEANLTSPGEKLLSLGYGAPEQESDASTIDERADVYGLGGILFFAITGQNPRYFREQDIPATIVEPLVKALATDREQRWPSAAAFLEALSAVHARTRIEQAPAKTTWRCKWCDTINPVTIRFCSECGWDGVVNCPECGSENVVGMQFCTKCGANVRVYESMQSLVSKVRRAFNDGELEKVVSLAGQAHGFEPAGPSGRSILQDIRDFEDKARRSIARREQLKELIPMEFKAENYERVKNFILEYRALSGNDAFYATEFAKIPEYVAQRDFKRASRAYRNGDTEHALEICSEILEEVDPQNHGCIALRSKILRRRIMRRVMRTATLVMLLGILYAATPPAAVALARSGRLAPGAARFIRPAKCLYREGNGFIGGALLGYASLYGVAPGDIEAVFSGTSQAAAPEEPLPATPPEELVAITGKYETEREKIEDEFAKKIGEWPGMYLNDLDELLKTSRAEGDYYDVNDVREEITRFSSSHEWVAYDGHSEALADLQRRHLELTRGYSDGRKEALKRLADATEEEMGTLMKRFVQQDDMASARAVLERINALKEENP